MPLALITWLDAGPGASPPGIWGPTDPRPTHPIAPGGLPPHIWTGPWLPPYPDQGLPGQQPRPDNTLPGNQPYPDQGLPGQQPRPDHGLPPFATNLPVIPPQQPVVDPIDPTKAYIVAYAPKPGGGYERITFTVDMPERVPPTEAQPKG